MTYNLIISASFKKSYAKLPKNIQLRIDSIILKLKNKLLGAELKGKLKDFYSIHFEGNQYRLIYKKEKSEIQLLILYVGKRKERFYKDLGKKI